MNTNRHKFIHTTYETAIFLLCLLNCARLISQFKASAVSTVCSHLGRLPWRRNDLASWRKCFTLPNLYPKPWHLSQRPLILLLLAWNYAAGFQLRSTRVFFPSPPWNISENLLILQPLLSYFVLYCTVTCCCLSICLGARFCDSFGTIHLLFGTMHTNAMTFRLNKWQ